MATPKNALPVNFDQFRKNPVAAVAFCMLLAVTRPCQQQLLNFV
jgi:hypothetical protein